MKCFRHRESDAVGACKHCFKGVCTECAKDTLLGVVCSPECEEQVKSLMALVDRNKQAFRLVAKAHRRNAIVSGLFGASFIAFSLVARRDSFVFPFFLSGGAIFSLGALFAMLTARKYVKSSTIQA